VCVCVRERERERIRGWVATLRERRPNKEDTVRAECECVCV
jgi:hypothetical protein